VTKIGLDRPGIDAVVGQLEAAGGGHCCFARAEMERTLKPAASSRATLSRLVCSMSHGRGAANPLVLALMIHYSVNARSGLAVI
jgi:hypothetical protein